MPTDDERREVARRLRENAEAHPDMSLLLNVAFADDSLRLDGAMEWKVTPRDAAMRLADLIDPDTTSDRTKTTEDTTKAPKSSEITPTSSDKAPNSHLYSGTVEVGTSQVPECDATATCDVSQIRRDAVACDPTGRGIDSIYEWCFERLEGADGAEDELYCSIMRAIEDYRHPERATAHTVRAVDRDALLALADKFESGARVVRARRWNEPANAAMAIALADEYEANARRIREALGVVA